MQEKNPSIVLDAIIDAPKKAGNVTIGDITILKYAYLEKLSSPFISPDKEFSVANVIPTVFVLSQSKEQLRKYGNDIETLKIDALEWADDNLDIRDVPALIDDIVSKFTQMDKAAPQGGAAEDDPKKK